MPKRPTKDHLPVLTIPVTNSLTGEHAEIRRFQAEKYVFVVQTPLGRHKIFQVVFGRSDGSVYVTFPYFALSTGIVATGKFPSHLQSSNIDMTEAGKVTSNRLKYSHHPDGNVHFSQTGKVRTIVRSRSLPLNEANGHLFSVHIKGLPQYESDSSLADPAPQLKKTVLSFRFEGPIPKDIKFAAWWYSAKSLARMNNGGFFGPLARTQTPDGKIRETFLVGPPKHWHHERSALLVNCEKDTLVASDQEAQLLFIGGFGGFSGDSGFPQPTTFLCASYPASSYDDLLKSIGTIDL